MKFFSFALAHFRITKKEALLAGIWGRAISARGSTSDQLDEFVGGETCLIENTPERSALEIFAVERDRDNPASVGVAKITMRAGTVIEKKARPVKRPN